MPAKLFLQHYQKETILSESPYGNLYIANSRHTKLNVIARVIVFKSLEYDTIKRLEKAYAQTKRINHANIFVYTAVYLAENVAVLEAECNEQTVADDMSIRSDLGTSYTSDELFYFAYQIANALSYIHNKAAYENLFFSVRADSIVVKSNPLTLTDMHAKLSIFTAKWPSSSTGSSVIAGSLTAGDIFELNDRPLGQRLVNDIVMFGHLLLEMTLMRHIKEGEASRVCQENEETIAKNYNSTLLALIQLCLNCTQFRRTITMDIKDMAAFGLGLRITEKEFRPYSLREKMCTASKWIKHYKLENRTLNISEARDLIYKTLNVAMVAHSKGISLNFNPAHIRIVRESIIIYPEDTCNGHVYDFLKEIVEIVEPSGFAKELRKLFSVRSLPPIHAAAAQLELLLASIEPMEQTPASVEGVVAQTLFKTASDDKTSIETIYFSLLEKTLTDEDAEKIITMLPELQHRPALLSAVMRCFVERSVLPKLPFRTGTLCKNVSKLMSSVISGGSAFSKDNISEMGMQCLAPIGLVDKGGCRIFFTYLTALMIAAWYNRMKPLRFLLGELGYCTGNCMTALMFAAVAGNPDAASLLLMECGYKNGQGQTALMLATIRSNLSVVQILAPREAGMQDNRGWTALMYAIQCDSVELVSCLAKYETGYQDAEGKTALIHAVHRGIIEYVKILYEFEATMQTPDQMTALLFAVRDQKLEIAKVLLMRESSIANSTGTTALMFAVQSGNRDLVHLFIDTLPEPLLRAQDCNGWTALMKAAFYGYAPIVEALLPHESRLQTTDGKTALMLAAQHNKMNTLRILSDIEYLVKDNKGETALMYAARNNNLDAVELLKGLEAGAVNNKGHTALMIAIQQSSTAIIGALLPFEHPIQSRHGLNAITLAYLIQRADILRFIEESLEEILMGTTPHSKHMVKS